MVAAVAIVAMLGWWRWRSHRFDAIIDQAAAEYDIDPELIRAVVWKESRFNAAAIGRRREVGLMQVTAAAAAEWAAAVGRPPPTAAELLRPSVNVRAGAWYLRRAVLRWERLRDDPVPFALAEYNAGRSNAERWASNAVSVEAFLEQITYPATRQYVNDILNRYRDAMAEDAPAHDRP